MFLKNEFMPQSMKFFVNLPLSENGRSPREMCHVVPKCLFTSHRLSSLFSNHNVISVLWSRVFLMALWCIKKYLPWLGFLLSYEDIRVFFFFFIFIFLPISKGWSLFDRYSDVLFFYFFLCYLKKIIFFVKP